MRIEAVLLTALSLLGLVLPPAVVSADGTVDALRTHPIVLEGVAADRDDRPVADVTCTLLDKDGNPYIKDGRPVRDVTDRHGRYVLRATVRRGYRIGCLVPRDALRETKER